MSKHRYCIFDMSNILHRSFFVHKNEDDMTIAGIATHTALNTINKFYRQLKPTKIVMCYDRSNWRKEYTKSDKCVSGRIYKGQRRKDMSPSQQQRYELFLEHMNEFEHMIRDYTAIVSLANDGLEADDLIAGVIQTISVQEEDSEFVVVSTDKDFIQLLGNKNVRLINPATGEDRTLDEWDGDANLFLFEKCIRGETGQTGDNIQSAYPRLRKTRLLKAYNDEYERANLMMETWTDQNGKEFTVKDLFNENKLLMDLTCQPDDIKLKIISTVLEGFANPGKFSYFHFMKYCGKYQLKKIAEQAEQYVPMLS